MGSRKGKNDNGIVGGIEIAYYHGTSWPLYQQIIAGGYFTPPVYVSIDPRLAKEFSKMRVRFHPDPEWKSRRLVMELDLAGYPLEPDPDPEANVPGTKYYGKLFRVMQQVPVARVTKVFFYGFPQDLIERDMEKIREVMQRLKP